MASTYFSRIDLSVLHPVFAAKVLELHLNCLARGAAYFATSGLRTFGEQNDLYALGRTVPNVDATPQNPMGGTVTNAKGGRSYHNWGLAVDFALDKDTTKAGLQPNWKPEAYVILGEEARKLGLEWGGDWLSFKDYPHVQLKISKVGLNLAGLRLLRRKGGMALVNSTLSAYSW